MKQNLYNDAPLTRLTCYVLNVLILSVLLFSFKDSLETWAWATFQITIAVTVAFISFFPVNLPFKSEITIKTLTAFSINLSMFAVFSLYAGV